MCVLVTYLRCFGIFDPIFEMIENQVVTIQNQVLGLNDLVECENSKIWVSLLNQINSRQKPIFNNFLSEICQKGHIARQFMYVSILMTIMLNSSNLEEFHHIASFENFWAKFDRVPNKMCGLDRFKTSVMGK